MFGRNCVCSAAVAGAVAVGVAAPPAKAVVISTGDGTGNTSEPPGIAGWNNVVDVNVVGTPVYASGIYLGNGWMLTAAHVGAGQVSYDGGYYEPDGTQYQLTTTGYGNADLLLYQLSSDLPGLQPITIPTAYTLYTGSTFTAMGNGLDRGAFSYYEDDGGTLVATSDTSAAYSGYANNENAAAIRWGTNTVQSGAYISDSEGTTLTFVSEFQQSGAGTTYYEEQLAPGDSGGGVFDENDKLIGLNIGTNPPDGITSQPDASIFGDYSYYAFLPVYAAQIDADMATPEPAVGMLLTIGLTAAALRRRRSSRC